MTEQGRNDAVETSRDRITNLDRAAGRMWQRLGALICFAVAGWQMLSALANRAAFVSLEHYIGTAVFIGAFVLLGVFLWTRKQRLSDALDDAGMSRRG